MVSINAAALPDTLLESTLFGHVKGAFTGAVSERSGLIERLHPGGVLFFDEASSASAAIQAKLLRVFQSGEYAPVGAPEQVRRAHIHVIAATNAAPEALRDGTAMRADLFDRLAAPMIPIPPLRKLLRDGGSARAQAIFETLAIAVIRDLAAEGQPVDDDPGVVHRPSDPRAIDFETWATPKAARISRRLSHTARHHTWPGNLREAAQLIRQSLFISPSSGLTHPTEITPPAPATRFDIDPDAPLKAQLEAFEGRLYALAASKHSAFQDIGESLGVTRQTASRRMRHFELVPGQALEILAQPAEGQRDKPEERQLAALLERETETDPTVFDAAMIHYLDTLRDRARTHRFIDLSIAERIATSLRALAEGLGDDPMAGKMICAATRYFMEVEDDDHDFESVIGLDDDAAVVNAVARRLGRPDCLVSLD